MKKLNGIKKSLVSLENKKLKNLKAIQGGIYKIKSNISCGDNCEEYDIYESNGGKYLGRAKVRTLSMELEESLDPLM